MAKKETSKKAASASSRALKDPKATKDEKSAAGSALSQYEGDKGKKGGGKGKNK